MTNIHEWTSEIFTLKNLLHVKLAININKSNVYLYSFIVILFHDFFYSWLAQLKNIREYSKYWQFFKVYARHKSLGSIDLDYVQMFENFEYPLTLRYSHIYLCDTSCHYLINLFYIYYLKKRIICNFCVLNKYFSIKKYFIYRKTNKFANEKSKNNKKRILNLWDTLWLTTAETDCD